MSEQLPIDGQNAAKQDCEESYLLNAIKYDLNRATIKFTNYTIARIFCWRCPKYL